ncbi:PREDICTED: uncharacterized protein LOC109583442 isoform X2 [Amphimedon queenslandica]|uniref:Protein kinase domain-containing protein n=1 Tax=Amphimedon queenslandica TaxID=400682 RepID=A0AAN0JBJ8_AMPQE|nr:PREDICTED: uncharacterized protein LOC109583442 isoform X2 [Amphimedon queenslandica]|eukprot:XP_019854364.1 PREDICTED: uncharacterized protein LOC109583442 isoform X2 [Amphimedon queenslandica]
MASSKNRASKRATHHTVSVNNSMYVWAGNQGRLPEVHDGEEKRWFTSNVQQFTPSTGQWLTRSTTGTPPLGVCGYCCTAINDVLYYFGGYCGHDFCYHNSITQLDTISLQWRELESTDATRSVMRRAFGGMLSFDQDGVHYLLIIGGKGSKPAVQLQYNKYIEFTDGRWRTNEQSIYNISLRKWSAPSIIGRCIPSASGFIIEKINNTRAVLFGGLETNDDAMSTFTNYIYIIEVSVGTLFWQCIKKPEAICQWPMHRYNHAGAIIIAGPGCFMLVISGGSNSSGDTLDDCWILNTTQFSWIKLDVPHSVSKRMAHSLSVYIMSPHCVWMLTVGGIIDDKCELVANPNIALLTKLVTNNKGEWIVTDTLDTNVINNKEYKKKYQEVALLARRVWLEEYQKPRKGGTADIEQTVQALMKNLEEKEKKLKEKERELQEKDRELCQSQEAIYRYQQQVELTDGHWVINKDEVTLTKEELGRGSYAVVTVGIFRGLRVAVKSLHAIIISDYNQGLFCREMSIASQVRHPNLVQFIGATKVGNPLIVTELMSTSFNYVLQRNRLTNQQILSIAQDVALGLNYLHLFQPQPIIRRDVSSPNVLLKLCTGPAGYQAKVADYGTAKLQEGTSTGTVMPGNPAYAAPEAPIPDQHSPAMDIYSYSVLLIEMNLRRPPEMTTAERRRQAGNVSWFDMKSLIQRGLHANPRFRLTMAQVVKTLNEMRFD